MSHFYGYLKGNRGQTTRCGSKASGINAHIRSWNNDIYANLEDEDGKDKLILDVPNGLKVELNGTTFVMNDEFIQTIKTLVELSSVKKVKEQ